jgi:serine/threonine protein kinase
MIDSQVCNPELYPLTIEVAKLLNKIKEFRIHSFAILITSRLLTYLKTDNLDFQLVADSYCFGKKLYNVVENRYIMKLEMDFLLAAVKNIIYAKMVNPSEEAARDVIRCFKIAETRMRGLEVLKGSFKMNIESWIRLGKLPSDFKYDELEEVNEMIPFTELPEDQEICYSGFQMFQTGELLPVNKINVIYMTDQHFVSVAIWKAQIIGTQEFIALKECISPNIEALEGYIEEVKILEKLSGASKNFLKFYAAKIEKTEEGENHKFVLTIQMEFVENTLKNDKRLRDVKNKPYNDIEILSIYKQLILAFNLMRELQILHCDIKPSNIMITQNFIIKIIDFNAAKTGFDERTQQVGAVGTKDFMSPEVRLGFDSQNPVMLKEDKADVFSLGLTILSLVTNKPLVDLNLEKNQMNLMEIVMSIKYEWLKPILEGMLKFNYYERSGLKDLIVKFPDETTVTESRIIY